MKTVKKQRILVFASGTKNGGGSGFEAMVMNTLGNRPVLDAEIVGVVSNHEYGGVRERAERLGIPFVFWDGPFDADGYRSLVNEFRADYVMLSGWLKRVTGLDPRRTLNIHPGSLPRFGGAGMYGIHVHRAALAAFQNGEITCSAVTMHFVTEEYDRGPTFFESRVLIRADDTPETLAKRVNERERGCQSHVLNLVVQGRIRLADDLKTIIYT